MKAQVVGALVAGHGGHDTTSSLQEEGGKIVILEYEHDNVRPRPRTGDLFPEDDGNA